MSEARHPPDPGAARELRSTGGLLRLWAGLLAGPLAVLGVQAAGYAVLTTGCGPRSALAVHLAHAAGLALIGGGLAAAHREWRLAGGGWAGDEHGPVGRGRWMALAGLLGSATFALILVAQWLPAFVLGPCATG